MTQHKWFKCPSACDLSYCAFCRGGLALCTVCGGFEGTLTTECCGRALTKAEEEAIYSERSLDFIGGQWVPLSAANSGNQPQAARNHGDRQSHAMLSTDSVDNPSWEGAP